MLTTRIFDRIQSVLQQTLELVAKTQAYKMQQSDGAADDFACKVRDQIHETTRPLLDKISVLEQRLSLAHEERHAFERQARQAAADLYQAPDKYRAESADLVHRLESTNRDLQISLEQSQKDLRDERLRHEATADRAQAAARECELTLANSKQQLELAGLHIKQLTAEREQAQKRANDFEMSGMRLSTEHTKCVAQHAVETTNLRGELEESRLRLSEAHKSIEAIRSLRQESPPETDR